MSFKPLSVDEHHHYHKHPYYIFAPPYTEKSSGIRVLHYLCNILNVSGHEAYMASPLTNPNLWTPTLSNDIITKHFASGKKPIVIYPEVVVGAPLGIGVPVRLLLNQAGKIAGHTNFSANEIQISYRNAFSSSTDTPLLTIPCSDPSIFYPPPPGTHREGRYFYFSRLLVRGGELQDVTNGATEISPRHPIPLDKLPDIFRKAELLYCYEDGAITLEARMCGCPIAYIPNPSSLPEFPVEDWGNMGAAWGTSPDQIEHAKRTVDQIYPAALASYATFDVQLKQFIELTQSAADSTPLETCYASLLQPAQRDNSQEKAWLKAHESEEVDGQIWAERMMSSWHHQPLFHFYIQFTAQTQHLVDSTLAQFPKSLYPRWQVTVITDLPAPEGWGAALPLQWLSLRSMEHADYVLNEMVSASPCDWIAEIQPGIELDPHALLIAADHINQNPDWQFFDADEFSPNAPTGEPSLRLNTDFDLDFLREHNHLGKLVMVHREALLRAGRFGAYPQARSFDLALKIHECVGSRGMGHIPHVLSTDPVWRIDADALAQEQLALSDHFTRLGITADIQLGTEPHTRKVVVPVSSTGQTTFVVPIEHALELFHPTLKALSLHSGSELLLVNISGHRLALPDALTASGLPVRLIEASGTQWPQEAARHTQNQWLFVMSPYTTAPTPDDMTALQQTRASTGAAVVMPKLLDTTTPPSKPWDEWPNATAPANPIKQHCTHARLAINRMPLLVSKDVLLQHHGLDLAHHTLADAWVDFSARIAGAGQKMVWTPHISLQTLTQTAWPTAMDGTFVAQSKARLIEKHLSYLTQAADAHPDLLLQTPQAIHHHKPRTWHVHASERPRILALMTSTAADMPLRAWLNRMRAHAEAIVMCVNPETVPMDVLAVSRLSPDVMILDASPAPDSQRLMQDVKALLPHICQVVHVDELNFVSEQEKNCAAYMQHVLASCTTHADRLLTFSMSAATSPHGLPTAIDSLTPDMTMPPTWWKKGAAPIAP